MGFVFLKTVSGQLANMYAMIFRVRAFLACLAADVFNHEPALLHICLNLSNMRMRLTARLKRPMCVAGMTVVCIC